MHDRQDRDDLGLDAEVHRGREPPKECAADATVHLGVGEWRTADTGERGSRLIKELASQASALILVPDCGVIELFLRFLSQKNTVGHSALRILSITA